MAESHRFKFMDDGLNREFVSRLKRAGMNYSIDEDGFVHYSESDREVVEDDIISSIRSDVFPSWQLLTCPGDWIVRYKDYMTRNDIPFREELRNGELGFLIPRKHRPHSWKLDIPMKKERLVRSKG